MICFDAVATNSSSDGIQDSSEIVSSLVPLDQQYSAARWAEELPSLQGQQVWKVLLRIMVH